MDTSLKSGLLEMSRGLLFLIMGIGLLAVMPLILLYHHLSRKFN